MFSPCLGAQCISPVLTHEGCVPEATVASEFLTFVAYLFPAGPASLQVSGTVLYP